MLYNQQKKCIRWFNARVGRGRENMKISAIQNSLFVKNIKPANNTQNTTQSSFQNNPSVLMEDLNKSANLNFVSFKATQMQPYKINLSNEELVKRCENLSDYRMLPVGAEQYENLAQGDKEALKHLVKAARILNEVYLRQDNVHNIPFRDYLVFAAKKGNNEARMTLKLFEAQKGISAKDINGDMVNLLQGHEMLPGKGFFPEDLSKEEFHKILIGMLENGEKNEVKKILNQRSMIERDGDKLKAVDYTDFFKDEFIRAADELVMAAMTSTDDDFNRYLLLQANALLMNNPEYDSIADKAWAKLQYTPLEFTITRESYDDRMTPSVTENPKLAAMLKEVGITPYAKDNIGIRVGIVNKEGTDYVMKIKDYVPLMAENMPFNDEYVQNISQKDNNQSMVDADIVDMQGQIGAYRGAISLASNLPNGDKLAVQTGGGHRNVYHIQTRNAKYENNLREKMDALLVPSLRKYFDVNALHDFTILHENVHSLGPKKGLEGLGVYKNIIEENKADMGAMVMLDLLTKKGFYTPLQQKKIITSYVLGYVQKGPDFDNAHRKRNIMQNNYFIQNGAINVNDEGKIDIDFEKFNELSKKMLERIIRIQIDGNAQKAKEYIDENAVWTETLEKLARKLRKADTTLNSRVVSPLGTLLALQR